VLTDSNKRAVYDQFGEEGLKGGPPPGAGGAGGGMGGMPNFSGFSGGMPGAGGARTFSFGGPGGGGGFTPRDPNDIFASLFGNLGGGGGGGIGGFSFGGAGDDDIASAFGGGGSGGPRRTGSGGPANPFVAFGGMPGGMGGGMGGMGGMGGAGPRSSSPDGEAAKDIEKPLQCSLEELYTGATRKLKVGRRKADGSNEDKVLTVTVKPGWKAGTKVRFTGAGNEVAPGRSQDIVFVIEEKPHPRFKREGDDLRTFLPLPLSVAINPPKPGTAASKIPFTTLDGRSISISYPTPPASSGRNYLAVPGPPKEGSSSSKGLVTRIVGEGMPISKSGGEKKGDLVVVWTLALPDPLGEGERIALQRALSGVSA